MWKMRSGVHQGTSENLYIGPGVVYKDFVSPQNMGTMLGATKGGTKITINKEWHAAEIDGTLGPVKSARWMTSCVVEAEVNLLEFTRENLLIALPGAVIETSDPDYDRLYENGEITVDNYTTFAIVGEISGKQKPVIFVIKNAVAVDPLEVDGNTGKDDVVLKVKLQGHYTEEAPTTPPYEILYPKANVTPSTVEAPVGTPAPGGYAGELDVALSCATVGADIYYTLDGTDPIAFGLVYTSPIHLDQSTTIKAVAIRNGNASSVVDLAYTLS